METNTPKDATKYDSAKLRNTHQFITAQSVNLATNVIGRLNVDEIVTRNFEVIKEHNTELMAGCIAPDYGKVGIDRDYGLYQDHFIDPDTDTNFTAKPMYPFFQIKDTAESQARNYYSRAIATWLDGDKAKAVYYLGKSLHYFEDANEPHHASNQTGGSGTAHTRFEYYAEEVKAKYAVEDMDISLFDQFKDEKFISFISKMVYKHARMAKATVSHAQLSSTWDEWNETIKTCIGRAQEGVAVIIMRFLQEVSHPSDIKIESPIGRFHVIVKIADEKFAGTDDSISFGLKMIDGRDLHYTCDLAGNDFEQNTTGCYQFVLTESNNVKFEDIAWCYLRKDNKTFDDQAKVESVEVYMQGKRVIKETPNKWMTQFERVIKFPIKK